MVVAEPGLVQAVGAEEISRWLRGEVSDALETCREEFWGPMVVDDAAQKASTAAQIGSFFVPGGFLVSFAAGAAMQTATGVSSGVSQGQAGKAVKRCMDKLDVALKAANAEAMAAARRAGTQRYVRAQLCEQPVALNDGQATLIVEQMDPTNKRGLLTHFVNEGTSESGVRTANRFPAVQICTPLDKQERVRVVPPSEELEYELPKHRVGDVTLVHSQRDGHVRPIPSLLRTTMSTVLLPLTLTKDYLAGRRANKRDGAGLPSYGDFVIRKFVVLSLEELPSSTEGDAEEAARPVLVSLPPVYAQWPDDDSAQSMVQPSVLQLAPGPKPEERVEDRHALKAAHREVYNVFDGESRNAATQNRM